MKECNFANQPKDALKVGCVGWIMAVAFFCTYVCAFFGLAKADHAFQGPTDKAANALAQIVH